MLNNKAALPSRREQWVEKLTKRLDALVQSLKQQPGVLAVLGMGSTGKHVQRMDEYSDLDFCVIVEKEVQEHFLRDIGWLRAAAPIIYDFENSKHGRKILFQDGVFAEYEVLTENELASIAEPSARVVWSRDPMREWDEVRMKPVPIIGSKEVDYHLNEAVTNLFVGLLRDQRGEHLAAMRFIQVYAVDRVLTMQALRAPAEERRDPYGVERRAEQWAAQVPVGSFCLGYAHNVEAAQAMLEWLVEHEEPSAVMVEAVRSLLAGKHPSEWASVPKS